MVVFPISKVNALRKRAEEACLLPEDIPDGWSKSRVDPMNLIGVFGSLRIKPGFVLRAYQFREGGNGNGFIWALPIDGPFPDPMDSPRLTEEFLAPPKPPKALGDLMDAIDGDGTPLSYVSASVFAREAREFGAMWHGCSWSTHTILGADPWQPGRASRKRADGMERPSEESNWTWIEPKPREWRPSLEKVEDEITISFLTYSGLGKEAIYRHRDSFRSGCYRIKIEKGIIAEGPGGFVF